VADGLEPLRRAKRGLWFAVARLWTRVHAGLMRVPVGPGTIIRPGVRLLNKGGRIRLGARCEIHPGAALLATGGRIEIGDEVSIHPYSILYGQGGLTIGDGARIAAHCVIVAANHGIAPDRPIRSQPLTKRGVVIGADVWIGAGARILDGAQIADGCVIAAGAVVTAGLKTEPMGVYGGVPARRIGSRRDASCG
jgi:acetyltransferase-like isoleucine patch superfamily enzyme